LTIASVVGSGLSVPTPVIAAGAPAGLEFQVQPGGGPSNLPWAQPPVVRVVDGAGETVTTSNLAIHLTAGPSTGGILLCQANPVLAVNGIATFSGCYLNASGAGASLVATAFKLPPITSAPFEVGPPGPLPPGVLQFDFSALRASPTATAEGPIWFEVKVRIVDPSSNALIITGPLSTTPVTLSMPPNPPGATVSCPGGNTVPAVAGVAAFEDCSISKPGSELRLAAIAPGFAETHTGAINVWPPGSPRGPNLSMDTTAFAPVWGEAVGFRVHLLSVPGNAPIAGRVIHVQATENPFDPASWRTIGDATTGADGRAIVRGYTPPVNRFYRAMFDGADLLGPAISTGSRVVIRQKVIIRPYRTLTQSIPSGTTITFRAIVRPLRTDPPPGQVTWEIRRILDGQLTLTYDTSPPDETGTARLPVTFLGRGSWSVRAKVAPTTANANSYYSLTARYRVQ
jgi:hypothetical protein